MNLVQPQRYGARGGTRTKKPDGPQDDSALAIPELWKTQLYATTNIVPADQSVPDQLIGA